MKIGFLGSGGVAQTLGSAYLEKGHEVKLGTRSPEKLDEWLAGAGESALVGSFADAAAFGDVVFICTKGDGALDSVKLAGVENFKGKTVIDVTNPLDFSGGVPPKLTSTLGNSLGEEIQKSLPDAHVVKAFNTIGAHIMVDPFFDGQPATLFIAGNDESAKAEVTKLAKEFGWDVEDAGGIGESFYLEAFAMLWINYGFKNNHWNHAFRFMKK